ncbi:NAD(P)H-binding protein [Amycolatopsis anabasis]|uniref:NAD(P)H-binding protein n=1 Tax=Amycolatopsis anabasis TaxID=1840409 RepID=UPI00131E00B8|nr:NAD(P)H-binding protein [Amycolatopsis anabasis]
MTFLVTGARGKIGRHVVDGLLAAGKPVRASSRDTSTLDVPAGVEAVRIDLEEPDTVGEALDGVDGIFLYTRPRGLDGFLKAAGQAGARRVVLLSSAAVLEPEADTNPIAALHQAAERAVRNSGLAHTVLHPGYFASNALGWAGDIRAESAVHTPYPDARIGAIHEADIAAVAAHVLVHGRHHHDGEALALSGPEPISFREQAAVLADVLGRPIAVRELTPDAARERMVGPGMPAHILEAVLRAWSWAVDKPAPVTGAVEAVTGTAPRTFRQWVLDHRAEFEAPGD